MQEDLDERRCLELVAQLNAEHGWGLTPQEQREYAQCLARYCTGMAVAGEIQLRAMIENYHLDHPLVDALRDPTHPDHAAHWMAWFQQALRRLIVKSTGASFMGRAGAYDDDLAQEALYDLWRGLATFRYQSRFQTWAFTVIGHCLARHNRAIQTHKRRGIVRTGSLDALLGAGDTIGDSMAPSHDDIVLSEMLAHLSQQVLRQHPDLRLATIFRLWTDEDQTLRAIGQQLHLSVTRVYTLLQEARALLQNDAMIRSWKEQDVPRPHTSDDPADRPCGRAQ